MSTVEITGMVGSNPLSFMAAVGLLRVAADSMGRREPPPRLAWHPDGWHALLDGFGTLEEAAAAVVDDCDGWLRSPLLRFKYPKVEKNGVKPAAGLTPPLGALRRFLRDAIDRGDWRQLEHSSGLMTETSSDPIAEPKRPTKADFDSIGCPFEEDGSFDRQASPTFFDFTARNTQFLDQVRQIGEAVDENLALQALRGVQIPVDARSLGWDPTSDHPAALYSYWAAANPVLEWLAFRGLSAFLVVASGGATRTTACTGRRKNGTFVWPIWGPPCRFPTVKSLLAQPIAILSSQAVRNARGVLQVFAVDLTKSLDGYTGVFSPTRVV